MRKLEDIRVEIDEIDEQIVKLFKRRMNCAGEAAEYKMDADEAVMDKYREKAKICRVLAVLDEPKYNQAVEELFRQLMSLSRRYQYSIIGEMDTYIKDHFTLVDQLPIDENTTVVYQGMPGAYQEEAMVKYFGEGVKNFTVKEFKDVLVTLDEGKADYGILPIENSSAGTVSGIYDLLLEHDVFVVGEVQVECKHMLAGLPGTDLKEVTTVYSHPQALMQCEQFLSVYSWGKATALNTAIAAKQVAEKGIKRHLAICSERAAKLYGLEIYAREINHESNNRTRFVIFSKKKVYTKDAKKICVSFSAPHEIGSLHSILGHFTFNGVSMTNIESRPLPNRLWEYGFYIDVLGNLMDPEVENALKGIREEVHDFKILGNF
ncbi:MAG: prephenate dehydratase domain-containing protein [Lachnospiraceae bacterium]|nr:prephenate dehydratase domain-containing protein [Lachnospiraceae bacterium]